MVDYRKMIRTRREAKHMTQAELADMAGITQAYVYEIECGRKTPSLEVFFKLCDALDIKIPDE